MKLSHRTVTQDQMAQQPTPALITNETPSEKVMRESRAIREITDETGRHIVYRNLSVLEEARLARFLGAKDAGNAEYMKYVRIACAVQTIDGAPGVVPNTLSFIEQRIDWVGDNGYLAVWTDMIDRHKVDSGDGSEEEIDEDAVLKNS